MDECTDSLGERQILSILDLNLGSRQFEVDEKEIAMSLLLTRHRMYRYNRIMFGLKNAQVKLWRAKNVTSDL